MNWLLFVSVYGLVGLLLGEGYLRGCRKVRHEPDGLSYVLGMVLWPATLVLWVVGAGRKR